MNKTSKGEYGYLSYKKKLSIAIVAVMMALVLTVYLAALIILGTNRNIFSILAALICLPTAKFIVNLVMFFKAKGCPQDYRKEIEKHKKDLPSAYDLYMTSYSNNFDIAHACVSQKSVICLESRDSKCDLKAGETHIRKMMQSNGYHGYTVKIFDSMEKYLDRMDQLNRLADADNDEKRKEEEEIIELLYRISL